MKRAFVWALLVFATNAFAVEKIKSEKHFQFLNLKCEASLSDELDASPQSPPLDIDDPGTPGCNRWEVNVLLTGDLAQDQKNWELPLFDINYGVGNDIQLKYEVPMAKNQTADGTASGVGESKAGIKAEFYEDEKNKLEIAAYPQVKFITLNSRAQENGLAASGTITTLPLLLSKKIGETRLGDIIFSANLGYNISSKADTEIFFSAATGLGMKLSRHVALMGDLSTEQSISKGADGTRQSLNKIAIGALGSLSKKFLAFVSVGESVYASDQQNHTYAVTGIRLMTDGSRQ